MKPAQQLAASLRKMAAEFPVAAKASTYDEEARRLRAILEGR